MIPISFLRRKKHSRFRGFLKDKKWVKGCGYPLAGGEIPTGCEEEKIDGNTRFPYG
jgi:hypothetical protein